MSFFCAEWKTFTLVWTCAQEPQTLRPLALSAREAPQAANIPTLPHSNPPQKAEAPQRKRAADGLSSVALAASANRAASFYIRSTVRGGVLFVWFFFLLNGFLSSSSQAFEGRGESTAALKEVPRRYLNSAPHASAVLHIPNEKNTGLGGNNKATSSESRQSHLEQQPDTLLEGRSVSTTQP